MCSPIEWDADTCLGMVDTRSVEVCVRDAAASMRWIVHADFVTGRCHLHRGFESRPCGRDAGIDDQNIAFAAEAEYAFDPGTEHPPRGAGIPGPAAAPDMRRDRIDIGRDDMANDPGLARNDGRVPRTAEIDAAIQQWCSTQTIDNALTTLQAADVPVGKIYSVKDMMSDAQFLARDMFEQHQFADGTPVKLPGITPKMSETPGQTRWLGPELGAHSDEILQSLGYDEAHIKMLRDHGVV